MTIGLFRQLFFFLFAAFLMIFFVSGQSRPARVDFEVTSALQEDGEARVIVLMKPEVNAEVFHGKISRSHLQRLKFDPEVEGVFLDYKRHILLDTTVPLVNASLLWPLVYNGSNITGGTESVCVIDTGVNYSHPDMGGCSAGSFLNGSCAKVPSGYDFVNSDFDPSDDHGHGTHVAGIIASENATYRGMAPSARIVSLKACDLNGDCYDSAILDSIDWCVSNRSRFNISVISISIGGGSYSSYCDSSFPYFRNSINSAVASNISVVIAAGNSGSSASISAPACIRNATAVSSSTRSDQLSSFTNRNNLTDLVAPGSDIVSLDFQGTVSTKSGTSMSTPHVSGAFALISNYMRVLSNSTISPAALEDAFNRTGRSINDSSGNGITFRRISVYDALLFLDPSAPNVSFVSPTPSNGSVVSSSSITINITANRTVSNALLEWNGSNYSMSRVSDTVFFVVFRNFTNGDSGFRVFANNSANIFGATSLWSVVMNNSGPAFLSKHPESSVLNIAEPSNQSFNMTFNDTDPVSISWLLNGSNQSGFFNISHFNFTGAYNSSGSYNITVIVSDGHMLGFLNWTLLVNNTDQPPVWNVAPQNFTIIEDANLSFNLSASDPEGSNVTYFVNDSRISVNSSGHANFTSELDYFGVIFLNVTASSPPFNVSEVIFINVTAVNDMPSVSQISNMTVNETDWINLTVSASDVESLFFNYSVNFSGFSQDSSGNFSWRTNLSSSGSYSFMVNVTDGEGSSAVFFNVSVVDRPDFDSDGVPDIYDSDDDNDGILDDEDYLFGYNHSFITLSGSIASSVFNISVNGTSNLSQRFNDTVLVNLTNGSVSMVEFYWNFTNSSLYLNFSLYSEPDNSTFGAIMVRGLALQQNRTKNVSIPAVNDTISTVCVKDSDVESLNDISRSCNNANETLVSCPGSSLGYACSLFNTSSNRTYMKISGLRFSAVRQQCPDADADDYYASGCGNGTDCDDARASVHPGASESCNNNLDDNCNGQVDEGCGGGGSSSGGGGGGGGGVASQASSKKITKLFMPVEPGKVLSMGIKNPSVAFSNITFASLLPFRSLSVSVEPFNGSGIEDAYQYLNITVSPRPDDMELETVFFYFSVNKSWLELNGFERDSVVLRRFRSYVWQELPVRRIGEDLVSFRYVGESPGFSMFAITAVSRQEKPVVDDFVPIAKPEITGLAVESKSNGSDDRGIIPVNDEVPVVLNQGFHLPVIVYFIVPMVLILFMVLVLVFLRKGGRDGDDKLLEDYVERTLALGHSRSKIRAALIAEGWPASKVDLALRRF
ncbi:S8 family serine peptidase [Candidatus Woesearchaeota archaeon]|nr:S8 family serine peptidase [Candidatus Woesearchaeota archaeon]